MNDIKSKTSGFGIGEIGRGPASTPMDNLEAERLQPPLTGQRMVKCDCGHTVPAAAVMNASLGTSCPECYDEMSG